VLDNLTAQVHGVNPDPARILPSKVDFIPGDIRDEKILRRALEGIEVVYHLAAQTGVGQSMYEIKEYISCNIGGTAQLLDLLVKAKKKVSRLIVASSRAVYGEGKYSCPNCAVVYPPVRYIEQMDRNDWEVHCPNCASELIPLPTDEDKPLRPGSIYAISKRDQEEVSICIGQAYRIPTTALRFFNVYGSGQSLSNPYTGIITIFASRIRSGKPPLVYEDGLESRDFVHVSDAVNACVLAMTSTSADYQVINVGHGTAISVLEMARIMIREMKADLEPQVIGKYRVGDIRHCCADLKRAKQCLGYQPQVSFTDGLREFLNWAQNMKLEDRLESATTELKRRGLYR